MFLQSVGAALGTFLGSFTVDFIGYNWAFISAGLAFIAFTTIYAYFVGTGEHIDKNEDYFDKKVTSTPE